MKPSSIRVASRHMASTAEGGLEVVSARPIKAGFSSGPMMRNVSRGRPHDPNAVQSVEIVLSGTPQALLSREALYLATSTARRYGVYGGMARRDTNPMQDHQGRTIARFSVE